MRSRARILPNYSQELRRRSESDQTYPFAPRHSEDSFYICNIAPLYLVQASKYCCICTIQPKHANVAEQIFEHYSWTSESAESSLLELSVVSSWDSWLFSDNFEICITWVMCCESRSERGWVSHMRPHKGLLNEHGAYIGGAGVSSSQSRSPWIPV